MANNNNPPVFNVDGTGPGQRVKAKATTSNGPKFNINGTPPPQPIKAIRKASTGPLGPVGSLPQPVQHSPGGLTGFLDSIGHGLGDAAHELNVGAGKIGLSTHNFAAAGKDIYGAVKGTPDFISRSGDQAYHDVAAWPAGVTKIARDLWNPTKGESWTGANGLLSHPENWWKVVSSHNDAPVRDAVNMFHQTVATLKHPARDPFMTALTVLPAASSAAKLGYGVKAGMAGAETADLAAAPRIVNVPKVVKGRIKTEPLQFTGSGNPLFRGLQIGHDKLMEAALNKRAEAVKAGTATEKLSRGLKYAQRRVGGSIDETARRGDQVSSTLATQLDQIARIGTGRLKNRGFGQGLSKTEGNLALILRSANALPHEARDAWNEAVMEAHNPALVQHLADTAHSLHEKGVLQLNGDTVSINPKFTTLHAANELLKKGQDYREGVIAKEHLLEPQNMQNAIDIVNKKLGIQRPGQNWFTLKPDEKASIKYPRSVSSRVTGAAKKFVGSKANPRTGKGVLQGTLPANVVHSVAHTTRDAAQYMNKLRYRKIVSRYGSDVKTGKDDALVLDPNAKAHASTLKAQDKIAVGTHGDITTDPLDNSSIAAQIEHNLNNLFPFRSADHPLSGLKSEHIGYPAPKGYKWVPQRYLGDAAKPSADLGIGAKLASRINQAVTAATVYFKISHVPQRLTTNASTSAVSGALMSKKSLAFYFKLRHELDNTDVLRAGASTGTHGYMALPHGEGPLDIQNAVGRAASRGAGFYARRIDAPFRLLNLAHEARKAGIDTTAEFKKMLDYAENPTRRFANKQKYEQVLRRADSVSMAYDRLSQLERNTIARGLWFYPWMKAATTFGGHIVTEHPTGAFVNASIGKQGESYQHNFLGNLPSFEYGMVPVGKGLTSQPGYLFPFQTAGQTLETVAHPGDVVSSNLNPVYAAIAAAGGMTNPGNPALGNSTGARMLGGLVGATPEWRMFADLINPAYAAKKTHLFPHTAKDDLFSSFLGGPTYPKRTNKKALQFEYNLEHGRLRPIYIPNKKK